MPFRLNFHERIPPDGRAIPQAAHNEASTLGRDPRTQDFADRIAREIMRLNETGERYQA